MFDRDNCVRDLQEAIRENEPRQAVREVLERALRAPNEVAAALPVDRAVLEPLLMSDELTVLKVVWGPGMSIPAHDHRMWATIGVYTGQEDNAFFRRVPEGEGLAASGGKELVSGDVFMLGSEAIHAVTNPLRVPAGAIHVYGGDFFAAARSEWDENGQERPWDAARTRAIFEAANANMP